MVFTLDSSKLQFPSYPQGKTKISAIHITYHPTTNFESWIFTNFDYWLFDLVSKKVDTCHKIQICTVVHVTIRVGTLSIWRGAIHIWYMSKDFLGFIHSVSKRNIVGKLWFGYNCQFYTQKTQNCENLVISDLFKWHRFTSYLSKSAICILCLLVQNNQFKLKHQW